MGFAVKRVPIGVPRRGSEKGVLQNFSGTPPSGEYDLCFAACTVLIRMFLIFHALNMRKISGTAQIQPQP